jgi:hypothetical protein
VTREKRGVSSSIENSIQKPMFAKSLSPFSRDFVSVRFGIPIREKMENQCQRPYRQNQQL